MTPPKIPDEIQRGVDEAILALSEGETIISLRAYLDRCELRDAAPATKRQITQAMLRRGATVWARPRSGRGGSYYIPPEARAAARAARGEASA